MQIVRQILYNTGRKKNEATVLARTPANERAFVVSWAFEGPSNSLLRPYQDQEGHCCG